MQRFQFFFLHIGCVRECVCVCVFVKRSWPVFRFTSGICFSSACCLQRVRYCTNDCICVYVCISFVRAHEPREYTQKKTEKTWMQKKNAQHSLTHTHTYIHTSTYTLFTLTEHLIRKLNLKYSNIIAQAAILWKKNQQQQQMPLGSPFKSYKGTIFIFDYNGQFSMKNLDLRFSISNELSNL